MRSFLIFTLGSTIYNAKSYAKQPIVSPTALSIAVPDLSTVSAFRHSPRNQVSSNTHHLDDRRLGSKGGKSKSKSGVSKNNIKKSGSDEVSRSRVPYRVAGPVAALTLFWLFRRNNNFDANAQCFTQDAFEKALLQNVTQNTVNSRNDTISDNSTSSGISLNNNSTNNTTDTIYIKTTTGDPINLNYLSEKQIFDIKKAFNTTKGQEDYVPELCPSISAASSSKGFFVQAANVAFDALKQVFLIF